MKRVIHIVGISLLCSPVLYAGDFLSVMSALMEQRTEKADYSFDEFLKQTIPYATDIHSKDSDGWNILHFAAGVGNPYLVGECLRRGVRVNEADKKGFTPIYYAISKGNVAAVDMLLDAGAIDIGNTHIVRDIVESDNASLRSLVLGRGLQIDAISLQKASLRGYLDIVRIALEQNANPINMQDQDGDTLLHLVAMSDRRNKQECERIAELLLAKNARIDIRNKKGALPIHMAISSGQAHAVRVLLEKDPSQALATFEQPNEPTVYPLDWYALSDNPVDTIAEDLIKFGALLHNSQAPLCAVIRGQSIKVFQKLLALGCLPDVAASDGATPLMAALERNNEEIVCLLLADKRVKKTALHDGTTLLHFAAVNKKNDPALIKELQEKFKLDLGARDGDGYTALQVAEHMENDRAAAMLRVLGAK